MVWWLDNYCPSEYTKLLVFINKFTMLGGVYAWFLGQEERCE